MCHREPSHRFPTLVSVGISRSYCWSVVLLDRAAPNVLCSCVNWFHRCRSTETVRSATECCQPPIPQSVGVSQRIPARGVARVRCCVIAFGVFVCDLSPLSKFMSLRAVLMIFLRGDTNVYARRQLCSTRHGAPHSEKTNHFFQSSYRRAVTGGAVVHRHCHRNMLSTAFAEAIGR